MRGSGWTGLAALALMTGCAPIGDPPGDAVLPVKLLHGGGQCGDLERPTLLWIARMDDWRSRYARVTSAQINPPPPPAVDFPREGVLLIAMGQRPTGGYGLSLAEETAAVRDGVLTVRADWREPLPGYRLAQVITAPCLMVKLPSAGFSRIRVLDQAGQVRLEGVR